MLTNNLTVVIKKNIVVDELQTWRHLDFDFFFF